MCLSELDIRQCLADTWEGGGYKDKSFCYLSPKRWLKHGKVAEWKILLDSNLNARLAHPARKQQVNTSIPYTVIRYQVQLIRHE